MFGLVKRYRLLVHVLVAAQLLLSAPVVTALTASTPGSTPPCADMMMTGDSHPCPCCPDDVSSIAQCLSACTQAASQVGSTTPSITRHSPPLASAPAFNPLPVAADPPIKPPPIR